MGENALNWGVGGALGGGLGGAFGSLTNSLKSAANPLLGYTADTVGETVIDTVADAAQGGKITPGSVVTSLVFNAVTEGVSSNAAKNASSSEDRLFKVDLQTFGNDSGSQTNNFVDIDYDYFNNLDGHYDKHVIKQAEFGDISKQEYFHNALDLATSNKPTRELARGRTISFDEIKETVVIYENGNNITTHFKLDYKKIWIRFGI